MGVTAVDRGTNGADGDVALAGMQRDNTARVILDMQPDVLGVSEVEILRRVSSTSSTCRTTLTASFWWTANDGRGIDVGICIRKGFAAEVFGLRTHAHETCNPAKASSGCRQ